MLTRAWKLELSRLLGVVLVGTFFGVLFGEFAWALVLSLSGYLGWTLFNLHRLEDWLRTSKKYQPPLGRGIWGEVFDHVYLLQKRNRKRKRKLARILSLFQESTQALPDGAVVLNTEKEIQWVNDAAERTLGLSVPRDSGQRLDNFLRTQGFKSYIAEERWFETINVPSPVNRQRTLAMRMVPFAKDMYLMVVRDITEQLRLEQSQKDFVANVSHELRTPLTVLSGFVETLMDEKQDTTLMRPLEAMNRQVRRMRDVVEDLLLLEKLDANSDSSDGDVIDMTLLATRCVEDARFLSNGRHNIELGSFESTRITGDAGNIQTALANLLSNAVRYTPDGGSIKVRWLLERGAGVLEVKDSGDGIPPHHLPRLRERFYRVDAGRSREMGGTGLGLAIVHQIMERHDGRLDIFSEVSKGSRFRLVFPKESLQKPLVKEKAVATDRAD